MFYQKQLFEKKSIAAKSKKVIQSVGYNQYDIIQNILNLHCEGKNIDCDPTYSKGNFYKDNIQRPKYCFDIKPQKDFVIQANADKLLLEDNSIETLMFDPPFICGISNKNSGKMRNRFSCFKNVSELLSCYESCIIEFYRVLKIGGTLIFKCQDTVDSGKNHLIHCDIINIAQKIGFQVKDLFVLIQPFRIIDTRIKKQYHARKFHSYFLVFKKSKNK